LKLFGDRALEDIPNPRLRNLKEKTLRYRFNMIHIPGIKHKAADSISLHPTGDTNPTRMHLMDDTSAISIVQSHDYTIPSPTILHNIEETRYDTQTNVLLTASSSSSNLSAITWDKVCHATSSDPDLHKLTMLISTGPSASRDVFPKPLQEYNQYRHKMSTTDGVVLYNDRIVIPHSLRSDCLRALHAAHQSISSMIARAELSITAGITSTRNNCFHCNRMAPSQPNAPPMPPTLAAYPFQYICVDYFHYKGINYLVIINRYSNWPIVERA